MALQSVVDEWASSLFKVSLLTFQEFLSFISTLQNRNDENITLTNTVKLQMTGNGLSGRGS